MVYKCLDYFEATIVAKLKHDVKIYETCRYVNPLSVLLRGRNGINIEEFKPNVRLSFGRRFQNN